MTMNLIYLFVILTNAYTVQKLPENGVFENGNELYNRDKCTTCCRMMFVSDYNPRTKKLHEKNSEDLRYTLELEMEDVNQVRYCATNWEQTILAKPLYGTVKDTQLWELAAYKMFISYPIPQRVHDIRGGIKLGSKLIIWKKKAPLAASTNNQRFVFHHPYKFSNYNRTLEHHISAPFYTTEDVCYELTNNFQFWTGNNDVNCGIPCREGFQIMINKCDVNNLKQKFNIVYV